MEAPPPDPKDIKVEKEFPSFVIPSKITNEVKKIIAKYNLGLHDIKNVINESDGKKRILISPEAKEIPKEIVELVPEAQLEPYKVTLDYKNFSLTELLRFYIPEPILIPTSFETIGHIAHLNLLEEQLPYKNIIGKAIMLKNTPIKTVATKCGPINNVYRNMELEVIAGEDNFIASVNQSDLTFKMDFSKVYWNSRLQKEHDSVVDTFKEGALICDAMCGIGPFAVRAAKRKNCIVKANDLNPDSYKWLCENCKINGVEDKVECFNMDAREFIKKQFDDGGCDYIVMNLPGTAVEFLDAVGEGALKNKETARMPIVIFHSFDNKDGDYVASLHQRAQKALGKLPLPRMNIHNVRDVSPGKFMFRCSFSCADIFLGEDDKPAPLTH